MAKQKQKNRPRIQKFINYTKEAFRWPVHLVMMGTIATVATLSAIFIPEYTSLDPALTTASIVMMAGGLELVLLSAISNHPRFIRAMNAKYQKDIDAFYKTKTLVEYYNKLSMESQRRFDRFRERIREVRDSFKKLNTTVPQLVNRFLNKLTAIELSYARLLYFRDKYPEKSKDEAADRTVREIDKLNQELKNATDRIKSVKERRLKLLEMRMDDLYRVQENREIIEEQLKTIEGLIEYIKDQPMTLQSTERESIIIDNLLFETEQTQQSLEEIEAMMYSEFYPGLSDDMNIENPDSEFDSGVKE
ncbi:MAG: hypothetical protein AAF694_17755 [Bacteroidota bacterium]